MVGVFIRAGDHFWILGRQSVFHDHISASVWPGKLENDSRRHCHTHGHVVSHFVRRDENSYLWGSFKSHPVLVLDPK